MSLLKMDMKIKDNTDIIKAEMQQKVVEALESVGLLAEAQVKAKTPVDTGRLRNSITHDVDMGEQCAIVGTNVEYASFVEYGTSKTPAQPFLKNTIQENAGTYKDIIETIVKS